jgi:hypothetical protein
MKKRNIVAIFSAAVFFIIFICVIWWMWKIHRRSQIEPLDAPEFDISAATADDLSMSRYTPDLNVEYHLPDEMIKRAETGLPFGSMVVKDQSSGELIILSGGENIRGRATYYDPSAAIYGAQSYVPNYRDMMNLRR